MKNGVMPIDSVVRRVVVVVVVHAVAFEIGVHLLKTP
jgi:hypothetical protein